MFILISCLSQQCIPLKVIWPSMFPMVSGLGCNGLPGSCTYHFDDVIKWKYFRVTGLLCGKFTGHRRIPRTKANYALMFSLICAWINGWVNNREAGDLRRLRAHYDVTAMDSLTKDWDNSGAPAMELPWSCVKHTSRLVLFKRKISKLTRSVRYHWQYFVPAFFLFFYVTRRCNGAG